MKAAIWNCFKGCNNVPLNAIYLVYSRCLIAKGIITLIFYLIFLVIGQRYCHIYSIDFKPRKCTYLGRQNCDEYEKLWSRRSFAS